MRDEVRANRDLWDELTSLHLGSELYDLEGFRAGCCSLQAMEIEEVGDVAGRDLLHLQCHFGLDTLSWARRGARVTGVDFSPAAIARARELAAELGLPARFVECDLYELPEHLEGEFDIVFSSAGVLCWLPDLEGWGRLVARYLRPGGFFYLREFHPFAYCLDDDPDVEGPRLRYPYFRGTAPLHFPGGQDGDYAAPEAVVRHDSYEWPYPLSRVVGALLEAGLRLEWIREQDAASYRMLPYLRRGDDGLWRLPGHPGGFPLGFSLRARREV